MIKVKLLTESQAQELQGQVYCSGVFFNPIEDANGNMIISLEESCECTNESFSWVKDLPEIDFEPIVLNIEDTEL